MIMTKKKVKQKIEKKKRTIKCRRCFMIDTYYTEEIEKGKSKCYHCGEKIYDIDTF